MLEKKRVRWISGALLIALLAAWSTADEAQAGKGRLKRMLGKKGAAGENYQPGPGWQPYFKDPKGRLHPLVLPLEENKEKLWLGLRFTEYDGPKLRLAVMRVENKTGNQEQAAEFEPGIVGPFTVRINQRVAEVPVGSIEELLTTALYNTHRFDLLERKAIGAVLGEQELNEQTGAQVGRVLGAEYLIFAGVNEWSPVKSKMGGGIGDAGRKLLGGVAVGKKKAEVAMSFRIVDSTTGQVLFSTTERAQAGSWGIGLGLLDLDLGGLGGFKKNSPINYSVVSCIHKGVYRLVMWLKDRAWSGAVMKIARGQVYVNAGSDKGIQMGMKLTALSKGEELIDPTTGLSLGADTEVIGSLVVTAVKDRYSIASIVQGCAGIKVGDRVEIESDDYASPAEAGDASP